MTTTPRNPRRLLLFPGSLVLVLAMQLFATAGAARAEEQDLPEGLKAGPWILRPSLVTGYAQDSNVFYTSDVPGGEPPISDSVWTLAPTISAVLPFSNSFLRADYTASRVQYGETEVPRELSQDFAVDLSLYFGSRDRLDVRGGWTLGMDTLRFDQGGSSTFEGVPYDLKTQEVELAREVYGHRGYDFRLTRSDLKFDEESPGAFFDFTGYDASFDYREPLSRRSWFVVSCGARRYDHFEVIPTPGEDVPFRRERSEIYLAGLRGQLSERSPFQLRVGWDSSRFPGGEGPDFSGIVADGYLSVGIGRSVRVTMAVSRRPWATLFYDNNYYFSESFSLKAERRFAHSTLVGLEGWSSRARFDDPVPDWAAGAGVLRSDRTLRWRAYANLMIREKLGLRLYVEDNERNSNYLYGEFSKRIYFAGIVAGWL